MNLDELYYFKQGDGERCHAWNTEGFHCGGIIRAEFKFPVGGGRLMPHIGGRCTKCGKEAAFSYDYNKDRKKGGKRV